MLAGSPSVALPITTGWRVSDNTSLIFSPVGNAAPPRPRSPARSVSRTMATRHALDNRFEANAPWRSRWAASPSGPPPPSVRMRRTSAASAQDLAESDSNRPDTITHLQFVQSRGIGVLVVRVWISAIPRHLVPRPGLWLQRPQPPRWPTPTPERQPTRYPCRPRH